MAVTIEQIEQSSPADFVRRLKRLHGKQRQRVLEAMGDPPDYKNVKPSVWQQIRKEQELFLVMILMGLVTTTMLQRAAEFEDEDDEDDDEPKPRTGARSATGPQASPRNPDRYIRRLYRLTRLRSYWASRQIAQTTRRRLADWTQRTQTAPDTTESLETILDDLFGDSRTELITRTETGAAGGLATEAITEELKAQGKKVWSVWRLGSGCKHCKVCPMLEGMEAGQYLTIVTIPVHPNCCCWSNVVIGDRDELIANGTIRVATAGEMAAIRRAIEQHGFRSPPSLILP